MDDIKKRIAEEVSSAAHQERQRKLIAKEVSKQRAQERMREIQKVVAERRSRPPAAAGVTWGKAGTLPVPRRIEPGEKVKTGRVEIVRSVAAPPSRRVERIICVQQSPAPAKTRGKPGPKPGRKWGVERDICDLADKIMSGSPPRPRVHGWRRAVAGLVMTAMAAQGQPYSLSRVEKAIRSQLNKWDDRERG